MSAMLKQNIHKPNWHLIYDNREFVRQQQTQISIYELDVVSKLCKMDLAHEQDGLHELRKFSHMAFRIGSHFQMWS